MAESTLALTMTDLKGEVGFFLGMGRGTANGESAWPTEDETTINQCVKSGLRQFYYAGGGQLWDWSFLKPQATLVLPSGVNRLTLPDDFNGFDGPLVIEIDTGGYSEVKLQNPVFITRLETASPDSTGRPQYAASEYLKGTNANYGQRSQLLVYPTTDAEYTIRCRYQVHPDALTDSRPYPYGGAAHAETIRAACLMAAEETLDDNRGVWADRFAERLAASIAADQRHKPPHLGYNGDRSDMRAFYGARQRRGWWDDNIVTFNGVEYD